MGCGTSRPVQKPKSPHSVRPDHKNTPGNAVVNAESDPAEPPNIFITPEYKGAPTKKQWYHGSITNDEAEYRLRTTAREDGNYLVYDFYDDNGPAYGNYILLVFCGRKLYPWKISRRQDGKFILGEDNTKMVESYASVRELIKAHRGVTGKPLARLADGRLVKLTRDYIRPIPTDSCNAGIPASHRSSIQQRQRKSSDTSEQETSATKKIRPR